MKFARKHPHGILLNDASSMFASTQTLSIYPKFFRTPMLSIVALIQLFLEKQSIFFLNSLNATLLPETRYHLFEFFGTHSKSLNL